MIAEDRYPAFLLPGPIDGTPVGSFGLIGDGIPVALYGGEIRYNDAQIGVLVVDLQSCGLLEDSLLIVTADYGDTVGEHDYLR